MKIISGSPAPCLWPFLLAFALLLAGADSARALSESARSRLLLDRDAPLPRITPFEWDRSEDYARPASLLEEVPGGAFDLLGFRPRRLDPVPAVTPRMRLLSSGLVSPRSGVPAGLSYARRGAPDGICRIFLARESALALDDATFVQWHERAHCDRGYLDRELEESKANVQAYLMMAKTGDIWYAWQSIARRAELGEGGQPFLAPYLLGYRVAFSTLLPLLKRRGGARQERGGEIIELLGGMSERQVNALAMLLVEDAKGKQPGNRPSGRAASGTSCVLSLRSLPVPGKNGGTPLPSMTCVGPPR